MNARKWGFCVAALGLFLVWLFSAAARADLYCENENVSRGIPGQPDGRSIQRNYFAPDASRIEMGDGKAIIVDYSGMRIYTLRLRNRTYTQVGLNELGLPAKMSAPDRENMGRLMGGLMQQGIQITPTGETRTIEGYLCRKVKANFLVVQGEYWVSKEVKGYRELLSQGARFGALVEKNPMLGQLDIGALVQKLDGFPVQTVNRVMGGTVTSTLKRVEQKPLDPALFKVPKGYALKEG